ncbi:MAG: extensin family protein [Ascidiaceihabitans sp.]|nr:extensin family protein [Ascidiaceihabitans sp.]
MIRLVFVATIVMADVAWAGLDLSLRPVGRAGTGARNVEPLAERPLEAQLHLVAAASAGTSLSLRPNLRPSGVVTEAMARKRKRFKGAVCGDLDIQGEVVGRVPGKLIGCGVEHGVRVRSVAGVSLSQQSVMDCGTAKALKRWINKGVKPAVGSKGGGLSGLKVAAHYSCRTRNNKAGAKISEHGKGRAIDISGLVLNDGRTISVLKGWHNADSKTMRRAHKTACGPFGTVLGPNADRYHQDHFHFDTACYRSGPYCR